VIDVTRANFPARFGSEFDDFLFSSIGEDRNGLLLSVASMLARLNLDPWHEAATFAGLPVATAIRKLTLLIAALPDQAFKQLDPAALAARLIALLPRKLQTDPGMLTPTLSRAPGTTLSLRQVVGIILFILAIGFLAAQSSSRAAYPLSCLSLQCTDKP
jgi:hypothetical protein